MIYIHRLKTILINLVSLLKWLNALFAGEVVDRSSLGVMLTPYAKQDGELASSPKSPAYGLGVFRVYYPHRDGINWVYLGGRHLGLFNLV